MVGTGIFTTTGFLAGDLGDPVLVVGIWLVGAALALAGALRIAHRLYADAAPLWAEAGDNAAAARWHRDAALFEVAGSAREQRAQRAWERLSAAT